MWATHPGHTLYRLLTLKTKSFEKEGLRVAMQTPWIGLKALIRCGLLEAARMAANAHKERQRTLITRARLVPCASCKPTQKAQPQTNSKARSTNNEFTFSASAQTCT
jgi:hypothetical protein